MTIPSHKEPSDGVFRNKQNSFFVALRLNDACCPYGSMKDHRFRIVIDENGKNDLMRNQLKTRSS